MCKDVLIAELRRIAKGKHRMITHHRTRAESFKRQFENQVSEFREATSLVHISKRHRGEEQAWHKLTTRGGFTLAIKRNVGHTSCSAIVQILDAKVKASSVPRWERLLATSILESSRLWYAEFDDYVQGLQQQQPIVGARRLLTFALHSIRADATNSSTLQNRKVHVCELASCFGIPGIPSPCKLGT